MNKEVDIIIANKNDIEKIVSIYCKSISDLNRNVPKPLNSSYKNFENFINTMFDKQKAKVFKAVDNDIICGFLILNIAEHLPDSEQITKLGYICNLVIDEEYRHKGIGTKLIRFAEDYLKENEIFDIVLDVNVHNENAKMLYNKQGFNAFSQRMHKSLK